MSRTAPTESSISISADHGNNNVRRLWGLIIFVALGGLGLTALGVTLAYRSVQVHNQHRFDHLSERLRGEIAHRLLVYQYRLVGTRSAFVVSEHVDRSEFRELIGSYSERAELSGALGIGFIERVPNTPQALDAFIQSCRQDGAPDFEVSIPPGSEPMPGSVIDERMIIKYIMPREHNRSARGLDIGAHPVRREAAERAMITGRGSITGRIELVQDAQKVAGFLYLMPWYENGKPTDTVEQRIQHLRGWVYMPMLGPTVFDNVCDTTQGELMIAVYDRRIAPDTLIFSSDPEAANRRGDNPADATGDQRMTEFRPIEVGGQEWVAQIYASPKFQHASLIGTWNIGIGGTLLTGLLSLLIYNLGSATRRAHHLAQQMTEKIRRYAEHAQAATKSKSEFLANMSHEIRTPMTAILGFSDVIEHSLPRDHEAHSHLLTIRRNGQHLLAIINDILDLSKIEAGKLDVERIDTDLHQLMADVHTTMNVRAHDKQIDLKLDIAPDVPTHIQTDPVRLRQVIVNLAGNAVKFTQEGTVALAVAYDASAKALKFTISDTGCGISEEQLEHIFHAFQQADASTTREFGGTGLGLHISRRLANMLRGDIQVESRLGEGSRFTVTIPCVAATLPVKDPSHHPPRTRANPKSTGSSTTKPLVGVRILVAEDSVDVQRLLRLFLLKAGAEVTVVDNGQRLIEALTIDGEVQGKLSDPPPFDLVITDMQMPVMDGYSAVNRLRAKGCTLRILALTANAMNGDASKCFEVGCDHYLVKPIDRQLLIETCRPQTGPADLSAA